MIRLTASMLFVSFLLACTQQPAPVFGNPIPMSVSDSGQALGARISQSASGETILSWMERAESGALLRFSQLSDLEWQTAQNAIKDAAMFVNWADLPAVTAVGEGKLIAHWLSYSSDGKYSYDVLTSLSTDSGSSWSGALSPHADGTPTEHGFVSVWDDERGPGMLWLDGRNGNAGMTLRSAIISGTGTITAESLVDDLVCDCCQTDVAHASAGPVAVYRDRSHDEIRDIYVSRYKAGSWQPGNVIAEDNWHIDGCPVNGPAIDAIDDLVIVAWFTAADQQPRVRVAVSRNSGTTFAEPVEIANKRVLGRVGVALIDSHRFAVSWMSKSPSGDLEINLRGVTTDGQAGLPVLVGRTSEMLVVPQLARVGNQLVMAWSDVIRDSSGIASVRVPIVDVYE